MIKIKYNKIIKEYLKNLLAFLFGILIFLVLLIFIQWKFDQSISDDKESNVNLTFSHPIYDSNSESVGWKFLPNVKSKIIKTQNDQLVYEYQLTTDQFGRRIVNANTNDKKKKFLILLGGSNIVGEGLKDSETLDYLLSSQLNDYATYNYGVNGYGLGNITAQAFDINYKNQVSQKQGIVLYLFTTYHIDRLIGGLQSIDWIGPIPFFKEVNGQIIRQGFLQNNFPFQTKLKKIFNKSFLRKKYLLDWPFNIKETDIEWSCRLIAEMKTKFHSQFSQSQFILAIHPHFTQEDPTACLNKYEINFLDLRKSFDKYSFEMTSIKDDGHTSAFGNKILAEEILNYFKTLPGFQH